MTTTAIALRGAPSAERPPVPERLAPLSRTVCIAAPASGRVVAATLLGAGALTADIGLIGTAAWLISRAAQHPNESALARAIVAVQFFGLSRGLLRYGQRLVGHDGALRLLAELRVRTYQQLDRLAPAGLPALQRGDLLARIVRDVDSMQDLVVRILPAFGAAALAGSLTVVVMWAMLPVAWVIMAISLVLAGVFVARLTGALTARRERRFAATRGELSADVLDLTEGAAELIVFGAIDAQLGRIGERDANLTILARRSAGTAGLGLALTTLLAGLACWACLLVGSPAVLAGRLDSTELAVVTLIPLAALELVVDLPGAAQALGRVRQSAARLFEIFDAPSPVVEPETPAALPPSPHDLQARSVWASYPGSHSPVLRGVDLSLTAGRRVAVVGPSGAGKSSLAAALVRFLTCRRGTVTMNATTTDQLSSDELRSVVGLVAQEAHLFDASIAQNLAIGKPGASDAELREALDRVGLTDWIDSLPGGIDTPVGNHGCRLSGGQRQRLAVARALLAEFPLLVLDEPAEHLDPAAADSLTTDVLGVTAGRSLLLITHRLAGLEGVDEILVMEGGQVIERGTHLELLSQHGRYADLWLAERRTDGSRMP
jgi:thiol reductant ABC exporter CydC subunit